MFLIFYSKFIGVLSAKRFQKTYSISYLIINVDDILVVLASVRECRLKMERCRISLPKYQLMDPIVLPVCSKKTPNQFPFLPASHDYNLHLILTLKRLK